MVKIVVMTVWIWRVQGGEKVKVQDVDNAHGKNEGVYSVGGVLHVVIVIVIVNSHSYCASYNACEDRCA